MHYQCNTENRETCRAIVDIAAENGWKGSMFSQESHPDRYFWVSIDMGCNHMSGNESLMVDRTLVSIPEFIRLLVDKPEPIRMSFLLDRQPVYVHPDKTISCGCVTVRPEQVKELLAALDK